MSFEPIAADLAVRLTRQQAQSALPGAPVVPVRPERPRPGAQTRTRLARWLHRLASALEPDVRAAAPQASTGAGC